MESQKGRPSNEEADERCEEKAPANDASQSSPQQSLEQRSDEVYRPVVSSLQSNQSSVQSTETMSYRLNADIARLSSLPMAGALDPSLSRAGHMLSLRNPLGQDAVGLSAASLLGSIGSTSADLQALASMYSSLPGLAASSRLGLAFGQAQGTSTLVNSLLASQGQNEADAAIILRALGANKSPTDSLSGFGPPRPANGYDAAQLSDSIAHHQILQLLQQQRASQQQQQRMLRHENLHQINPLLLTQILHEQQLQQANQSNNAVSLATASLSMDPGLSPNTVAASAQPTDATVPPASGSATEEPERKRRTYRHESFPMKLHRLLLALDAEGKSDIACFVRDGTAFRILQPEAFQKEIIPKYFRHTKLRSFSRQLNMYGFIKIYEGPNVGGYQHPMFLKSRPDLCKKMERVGEGDAKKYD